MSCHLARRYLTILSLFVTILTLMPPPVVEAKDSLERWAFVVTYDPASAQSLSDHLAAIDVVVPGFFNVQTTGGLGGGDQPSLDRSVRAAGKRLLPLVQNRATSDQLSPLLEVATRRAALVQLLAMLPLTFGYDGLTLDFESVNATDRAGLTSFVTELAAALHGEGKQLAVAIPTKSGDMTTGWAGAYDDQVIGSVADRVILMAYAYRTALSTHPGPVSPLPWVQDVTDYATTVIPRSRLVLGIGVWGYDWDLNQPVRAITRTYAETVALANQYGGGIAYDPTNAAAAYAYTASDGASRQVWLEDAASVQRKLGFAQTAGLAGVALWRLGQEAPGVWSDFQTVGTSDFAIANGWFFRQTGGGTGFGYAVTDDTNARFWTEYRRLGGLATLGYPASGRYRGADGFLYQVFQRGVLQWRPELGVAYLANTFDWLSGAGQDLALANLGVPSPIGDDGSRGDWNRARQTRLSWLTNPRIAATFYANPNPRSISTWSVDAAIQLYGLPTSAPVSSGPFIVQRFQRVSLQLWTIPVSGMPAPGTVVPILGGDLLKTAGIVPAAAAAPQPPY